MDKQVTIIGAGPTGLGAAYRLHELGHTNWTLYEKETHAGGLASSFVDDKGFTWDIGGHVQFSHYPYFDKLMKQLLGDDWIHHERESWVWMHDRFIPYPFQNNLRRLPKEVMWDCVKGVVDLYKVNGSAKKPENFREWIGATFGDGIADHFMLPYNYKVWAYPTEDLSYRWIGDRVAVVDLQRLLYNIMHDQDDVSWGPNNTFQFPAKGGTGAIWSTLAKQLPQERMQYGKSLERVDARAKRIYFSDGSSESYEILLSTLPLDLLIQNSDLNELQDAANGLVHSSSNIIGLGLKGAPPASLSKKCWMYFPEDDCPFYRVTVFSHYAPANVPDPANQWSLMCEVSESPAKPVDLESMVDEVVKGALNTKLINSADDIESIWTYRAGHGYPTPSVHRDDMVDKLLPELLKHDIYSRGRFGAWRYEVGNQDHSLMQGVEAINNILFGTPEMTAFHPEIVNGR